jgi:hypothetical protein
MESRSTTLLSKRFDQLLRDYRTSAMKVVQMKLTSVEGTLPFLG